MIKEVDGVSTVFHYDFNGNIIAESDLDGNFNTEYLYNGKGRVALVDVSTGDMFFFLNDRLGTPQMLTDSTNTVVWEGLYKPFGEADVNPNSSVVNNFRFPGQYYDQETGLQYNWHRYYDLGTGRYLRPDPIGLAGGINLYSYANLNPVILIDPLGLDAKDILPGIRKALIGGVKGGAYAFGETGKFIGRNIKPSERTLNITIDGATIFGTASANIPATITFTIISGSAKALKSTLYSNTPCSDAISQGIQDAVQAPPAIDPLVDKVIDESLKIYIESFDLPRM